MKSAITTTGLLLVLFMTSGLSGCYTDTVDSLGTFTFQLPINMEFDWQDKQAPDTTVDRIDLLDYQVYRDNQNKIESSELFQIGYWIDTLVGDPGFEKATFEFVEFYLRFVGEEEKHFLGRYENVIVREYYKRPHIIPVPEDVARTISDAIRKHPQFDIIQRYSAPTEGSGTFPSIDGNVDLVIRFETEL